MINEQNYEDDDDYNNDKCELDIGGLLVTHSTNQLEVSHILTGQTLVHMSHHRDEEDKDERREGMTNCDILN